MQQQSEHQEQYNDEIDLADLVRSLWDGKWLVIGVTLATVAIAIGYLFLVPKTYTGSLEIAPLSSVEADVYTELNASKFVAIDEQILLARMIEKVKFRLRGTGADFSLESSSASNWSLNITSQNSSSASQIVNDALVLANADVNKLMSQTFERRRAEQTRKNKFALKDLELSERRALSKYETNMRAKLVSLSEQAQIARSLELSNGSLLMIDADDPLYLRGYVAIEKERDILQARKAAELFIPELAEITDLKLALQQDQTIIRADEMFAATPIGSNQFSAATYDIASIKYKSKTKSNLVLALAVVLGGMLGIFVLLIRNVLVKRD